MRKSLAMIFRKSNNALLHSFKLRLKFLITTMQFSLPKLQAGVESHLVL